MAFFLGGGGGAYSESQWGPVLLWIGTLLIFIVYIKNAETFFISYVHCFNKKQSRTGMSGIVFPPWDIYK